MMLLECFHEFHQHLFLGPFARSHIWMLSSAVFRLELLNRNVSILIDIKRLEGSLNKILSERVHLTHNNS